MMKVDKYNHVFAVINCLTSLPCRNGECQDRTRLVAHELFGSESTTKRRNRSRKRAFLPQISINHSASDHAPLASMWERERRSLDCDKQSQKKKGNRATWLVTLPILLGN